MATQTIHKTAADRGDSTRTKTEAKNMTHQNKFKHLHISGGFLDGFDFDFSEKLNCIIGSRGAGKTTILEFLRYAMNVQPLNTSAQKQLQAIVECNLGGGRIEVTVETADKVTYIISRKARKRRRFSLATATRAEWCLNRLCFLWMCSARTKSRKTQARAHIRWRCWRAST